MSVDVSGNLMNPDATITRDQGSGLPPVMDTRCDVDLPMPQPGTCTVTQGAGSATLLRGTLLTPEGTVMGGSLLMDGQMIECVGCDCSAHPAFESATEMNCGHAVISPGLINPHDHLTFNEGSPIDHGATRYDHRHEWRQALSTPSNAHGTGAESSGNRWGEIRMLLSGVTSYVGSGSATGLIRNLDRLEGADRALGFEQIKFQTFSLGDANRQFRSNCRWDYRYTELELSLIHV